MVDELELDTALDLVDWILWRFGSDYHVKDIRGADGGSTRPDLGSLVNACFSLDGKAPSVALYINIQLTTFWRSRSILYMDNNQSYSYSCVISSNT